MKKFASLLLTVLLLATMLFVFALPAFAEDSVTAKAQLSLGDTSRVNSLKRATPSLYDEPFGADAGGPPPDITNSSVPQRPSPPTPEPPHPGPYQYQMSIFSGGDVWIIAGTIFLGISAFTGVLIYKKKTADTDDKENKGEE